jgi:hypothetical protein
MTGSSLVPIITPIVALIALACWLGLIYWADAHPGWKTSSAAPRPEITGTSISPAARGHGDHHGAEQPLPRGRTAA